MSFADASAYVAFTADDFGRSSDVNRAVVRAYREGVLTSASLMVTGDAFEEAASLAQSMPSLDVGLHLVLADGRAALPPSRVSRLTDAKGRFPRGGVSAGLRCASGPVAWRQLHREIGAQFERFLATGLTLHHVDGHLHLHLHPAVLGQVIELARRHGAKTIRVPRDDVALACRYASRCWPAMISRWLALSPLNRRAIPRLREAGFVVAEHCFGLLRSGRMREEYVIAAMRRATGPAEFYFHPTTGPRLDALGPNPGDLRTLLSPTVRQAAERLVRRLCRERGQPLVLPAPAMDVMTCSEPH